MQIHILERKYMNSELSIIEMNIHKGLIHNKVAMGQVMAWHQTSEKPLPEAMMAKTTEATMSYIFR